MGKAGASFSVRFARNGDQITIERNIVDSQGRGKTLFQAIDTTSNTPTPDWSVEANQPIIQLTAKSSSGYPVSITNVTWAFDGSNLNFELNGSKWVTATNNPKFQARINGQIHELKIVDNIAGEGVTANKQITYNVEYVSNATPDSISGSVDIIIQQGGTNSHILLITTPRTVLSEENPSTILTAEGHLGAVDIYIGQNGYTIEWYQDGKKLVGQTKSTLNVTRSLVEGGSVFVAKLLLDGKVVAQDGQRINDIADEYQIVARPTSPSNEYASKGHDASYNLTLTKNGATVPNEGVTYAWVIYNSFGEQKSTGAGALVTIKSSDFITGGTDGNETYGTECDVQVTATF